MKRLDDGTYAVFMRLLFTHAIALNVDPAGYSRRFCYDDFATALDQWQKLETMNDRPEGWIARRPEIEQA